MLVEGLAAHITGEWLRTLLTGVPILLAAAWAVRHSSDRWRVWLWAHPEMARVRAERGVEVRPRWGGWRFEGAGTGQVEGFPSVTPCVWVRFS